MTEIINLKWLFARSDCGKEILQKLKSEVLKKDFQITISRLELLWIIASGLEITIFNFNTRKFYFRVFIINSLHEK